jgi:hypothetical protein
MMVKIKMERAMGIENNSIAGWRWVQGYCRIFPGFSNFITPFFCLPVADARLNTLRHSSILNTGKEV